MRTPPKSLPDLEHLVANRVQESLHLDYKESAALLNQAGRNEVSKDVSAFANSDGGVLIYGIVEDKEHFPVRVDGGVQISEVSHERLEHLIHANIAPRVEGIEIIPVAVSPGQSIYVVVVPRSIAAPHQDRTSKKYFRRYNFMSQPMEDYEIADIRSRRFVRSRAVTLELDVSGRFPNLVLRNATTSVVRGITFSNTDSVPWCFSPGSGADRPGCAHPPPRPGARVPDRALQHGVREELLP